MPHPQCVTIRLVDDQLGALDLTPAALDGFQTMPSVDCPPLTRPVAQAVCGGTPATTRGSSPITPRGTLGAKCVSEPVSIGTECCRSSQRNAWSLARVAVCRVYVDSGIANFPYETPLSNWRLWPFIGRFARCPAKRTIVTQIRSGIPIRGVWEESK